MKVRFLGSGGSSVSERRACPSVMVNESIVLDLGPGSLRNLRASHIQADRITKVFISHQHADHISDLVPFLWMVQIDGRKTPLQVFGPPGFKGILAKLFECTGTPKDFFKFPLTISEIDFGAKVNNISTCMTSHSIPTLAFRIDEDGKSFCYSADTSYCPAVVELAREADLLIHEATFLEDQLSIADLTTHSTAAMAGRAGRESDAKQLALFHIPPPNEHREDEFRTDATKTYGRDIIVGRDLAVIEV